MACEQPWEPADATERIRKIARDPGFTILLTEHARDRMDERDLITGDIKYVLQNGFVFEHPEASTRTGFYKYKVENRSPNSGARTVRVIAIPDPERIWIKAVTVMWVDGA